ncbi:hypothetical protein D3C80_1915640 [compost metagenome]
MRPFVQRMAHMHQRQVVFNPVAHFAARHLMAKHLMHRQRHILVGRQPRQQ